MATNNNNILSIFYQRATEILADLPTISLGSHPNQFQINTVRPSHQEFRILSGMEWSVLRRLIRLVGEPDPMLQAGIYNIPFNTPCWILNFLKGLYPNRMFIRGNFGNVPHSCVNCHSVVIPSLYYANAGLPNNEVMRVGEIQTAPIANGDTVDFEELQSNGDAGEYDSDEFQAAANQNTSHSSFGHSGYDF